MLLVVPPAHTNIPQLLVPLMGSEDLQNMRKSPRRELLDQAQARASCTPPFWGHPRTMRTIPQGMIVDVQPPVKSLFCQIRQSPKPLSPETGCHFLGGGGGGQKFVLRSLCSAGFERGSDWAAMTGRPAPPAVRRPGTEPLTYTSAVGCIIVRLLLDLTVSVLPTA